MKNVIFYNLLGYPNIEKFKELIKFLDDKQVEFFEIGIPSSNPIKDGPDIANLHPKSKKEVGSDALIELLKWIKENSSIKIILMTYFDGFEHYQLDQLSPSLYEAILCVDNDLANYPNVEQVKFYTPTMTEQEIKKTLEDNSAFCYVNSGITTTGGQLEGNDKFQKILQLLRKNTSLPLFVGFGIKNKRDKESVLNSGADGIIIGSEFIRKISQDTKDLSVVKEYIESFGN